MTPEIPGARMLEGPSPRGGGNLLYVVGEGADARVLKLYRRRRAAWRAPFRTFGHWIEGKRGVGPQRRHDTERELLTLWRAAGFDVPRVFDDPLPDGVDAPGLWMEFCPGPTLYARLSNGTWSLAQATDAVQRFAAELGRRQQHALKTWDVRFVHEHASINHVLVFGERLVSFDLEGAWLRLRSVLPAVADELASIVRTICRADPDHTDALLDAFASGYGDIGQLYRLVERGLRAGLLARVKGLRGKARMAMEGKLSKRAALKRLRSRIEA